MRLLALMVDGIRLDEWTTAPLFVLEQDGSVRPRPPAMAAAAGWEDADVAAFPAVWGTYRGPARRAALALLDRAAEAGLRVVVWVEGDQEIDLDHPAAVLFEQGPSAARARRRGTIHAWPVLIHDYVQELFDGDLAVQPKGDEPVVGFCGQAAASLAGRGRLLAHKLRDRVRHTAGRTDRIPAPLASHLRLRRRVLSILEADHRVATDFVVRDQYRDGVESLEDRVDRTQTSSAEFFDNLRRTQYALCVRGGGNFSKRLYEALCVGRIPVIVDTDQLLPWAGVVPWHELAVIVPAQEVDRVADRVVAHHAGLDDDGFLDAQRACRRLWLDRLSVPGYFRELERLLA